MGEHNGPEKLRGPIAPEALERQGPAVIGLHPVVLDDSFRLAEEPHR
ncbi:hypothetical protein MYX19_01875 [Nitrospinae bacterium AH-259-F20]|nr:hypothetical protein [Nitrospinae bacterium AH-259-F20]